MVSTHPNKEKIMLTRFWNSIIRAHWPSLAAGHKIWLEVSPHDHPKWCSAFRSNVGWPDGQSCDYTMSFGDGSRMHAQCYGAINGSVRVRLHRDRFDPDKSLANFLLHGIFETPAVPALVGLALVASLAK